MPRVILFVLVLFFLLTVLRGLRIFLHAYFRGGARPAAPAPPRVREAELVRDPICGTWVDRAIALTARRDGREVSVCSEACRRELEKAG